MGKVTDISSELVFPCKTTCGEFPQSVQSSLTPSLPDGEKTIISREGFLLFPCYPKL